jgi:hypothetical protein
MLPVFLLCLPILHMINSQSYNLKYISDITADDYIEIDHCEGTAVKGQSERETYLDYNVVRVSFL